MSMNYKLHENGMYTQKAQELSDYAARFQSSYWTFVGSGVAEDWEKRRETQRIVEPKSLTDSSKHVKKLVTN